MLGTPINHGLNNLNTTLNYVSKNDSKDHLIDHHHALDLLPSELTGYGARIGERLGSRPNIDSLLVTISA